MRDLHSSHCDAYFYRLFVTRLVEAVARIYEAENSKDWSPTVAKKNIEAIEKKLTQIANILDEAGCAQFDIENIHNAQGFETVIGENGWPVKSPIEYWSSYKSIILNIRDLAESARLAMMEIPDPRKRNALEFAARGYLHLRSLHGFDRPVLSNNGPDVIALKEICEAAGIFLSEERYRGALSESLKNFDPHCLEPGLDSIFYQ